MANLKNITDLPVAESAEGLNLIVNDNGAAKQIAASAVGAQADWAETDETSPAFIKNKPVEEWDLDITVNVSNDTNDERIFTSIVNVGIFSAIKNKIINNEPIKIKEQLIYPNPEDNTKILYENFVINNVSYFVAGSWGDTEKIAFRYPSVVIDSELIGVLYPDNTIITKFY